LASFGRETELTRSVNAVERRNDDGELRFCPQQRVGVVKEKSATQHWVMYVK